jgi:hypothetical protein
MRVTRKVYQTETAVERDLRMAAEAAAKTHKASDYTADSMRRGELGIGCRGVYGVRIEEEFPMLHGVDK